jgi:glycosyltransferase involved in cell wall biosynthesis
MPLIDAIVTFYNEPPSAILATVGALAQQAWGFQTIFLVDDGSQNPLPKDLLDPFPSVCLIRNAENKGISFSRNLALSKTHADYIACVNVDILPAPGWSKAMVSVLEHKADVGCTFSHLRPHKKNLLSAWRFQFHEQKYEIPSGVVAFAPGHAVMFRRADLVTVGGYNTYFRKVGEDNYISQQLRKIGLETWYQNEPLSVSIQKDTLMNLSKKHMARVSGNNLGKLEFKDYLRKANPEFILRLGRNIRKFRWYFLPIDIIIYLLSFYYFTKSKGSFN